MQYWVVTCSRNESTSLPIMYCFAATWPQSRRDWISRPLWGHQQHVAIHLLCNVLPLFESNTDIIGFLLATYFFFALAMHCYHWLSVIHTDFLLATYCFFTDNALLQLFECNTSSPPAGYYFYALVMHCHHCLSVIPIDIPHSKILLLGSGNVLLSLFEFNLSFGFILATTLLPLAGNILLTTTSLPLTGNIYK